MRIRLIAAAVSASCACVALAGEPPMGVPGVFGSVISATNVGAALDLTRFLGAPDDVYYGLGNQFVTFDFGLISIIDGPGADINIYEVDNGIVEFNLVNILVSDDGITFVSINSTIGPAVDLIGDEVHGNASFRRGFDLAGSGLSSVRFLRVQGTGSGAAGGNNGFDLDAVAAVNFIPTPGAIALVGMGGLTVARRRR